MSEHLSREELDALFDGVVKLVDVTGKKQLCLDCAVSVLFNVAGFLAQHRGVGDVDAIEAYLLDVLAQVMTCAEEAELHQGHDDLRFAVVMGEA